MQRRGDLGQGRLKVGKTQGWKIRVKGNLEREGQGRPRERKTQGEEPQTPRIPTIRCLDEQQSEQALHSPSYLKMVSDVIISPFPGPHPK